MAGGLNIRGLERTEIERFIDAIAALRIEVFRDWPYLYDGDLAYERHYLQTYLDAPNAFIAGAFDGEVLVGASTAMPMREHEAAFSKPLIAAGMDVNSLFYFGESVLRHSYRGQGAGLAFFDLREAEAKRQNYKTCVFAAVERPKNHKLRPDNYVPLDAFWQKRGYAKLADVQTHYAWRDIGETKETNKPMNYWLKSL